jgi:hypothetical protein
MKRTAAVLLALQMIAGSAQAMTVSKEVGPLLIEAQALIAAKNYNAATAKLNEAEAKVNEREDVTAYPDDETVIDQFRQVIGNASSHPSLP